MNIFRYFLVDVMLKYNVVGETQSEFELRLARNEAIVTEKYVLLKR